MGATERRGLMAASRVGWLLAAVGVGGLLAEVPARNLVPTNAVPAFLVFPSASPPSLLLSSFSLSSSRSSQSSSQNSQADDSGAGKQESSSRRSGHHVRVPVEDEDSQPVELKEAEAAIDRKDYLAAEDFLHKLLQQESGSYV